MCFSENSKTDESSNYINVSMDESPIKKIKIDDISSEIAQKQHQNSPPLFSPSFSRSPHKDTSLHFEKINKPKKITLKDAMISSDDNDDNNDLSPSQIFPKYIQQKIKCKVLRSSLKKQKKTNQNLRQKNYRNKCKLKSLSSTLQQLKQRNLIQEEEYLNLMQFSKPLAGIFKRQLSKAKNQPMPKKYSPEIITFAMNLNFYSPKAYDFVRKAFNNVIPHPKTLSSWYKSVDAKPGFTKEAFNTLQSLVSLDEKHHLYCNLSFDEIHIRTQVEWVGDKAYGYVDFGDEKESDVIATQVLVFMLVCVNKNWKMPLGYFPISSINSSQKVNLIHHCLENIYEAGDSKLTVIGLTFDGAPNNIATANLLGCKTTFPELNPNFIYECKADSTIKNLLVFPDPCHMLKNIRNCLADTGPLLNGNGEVISWEFLEKLLMLQEKEGLHLGNKVRRAHVFFENKKMNVRLAVQALSNSVADALQFCCEKLKLPEFQNCMATVEFIRIVNNVFDILNSRDIRKNGFKQPICNANYEQLNEFIPKAIEYLQKLKFQNKKHGDLVCTSRRRTGFIGFILCLKTVPIIYKQLVKTHNLKYVPFYKLNQDHLELFFCSIRSRLGSNNNPTVRQFQASYKRLIVHTQIKDSGAGNCIPLESISILSLNSKPELMINATTNRSNMLTQEEIQNFLYNDNDNQLDELENLLDATILSEYIENVVEYIAGFIVFKLVEKIVCVDCLDQIQRHNSSNSLISFKNRGGLKIPSVDVVKICSLTEKQIRIFDIENSSVLKSSLYHKIIIIVRTILLDKQILSSIKEHDPNHYTLILNAIIEKYIKIRFYYIASKTKVSLSKRSKLNRLVIFQGS